MNQVTFYKCAECGYEFLAKSKDPACSRCKSRKLDAKDMSGLIGLND